MTTYGGGSTYGDGSTYGSAGTVVAPPAPVAPARPWLDDCYIWRPSDSSAPSVTFHRSTPARPFAGFTYRNDSGFADLTRTLHVSRGSGQWGGSARSAETDIRELDFETIVWSDGLADHRARVAELARAFATPPSRSGVPPRLGRLEVVRYGRPTVDIAAFPVGRTPREVDTYEHTPDGIVAGVYAVTLECPDPRFREIESAAPIMLGAPVAGLEFPWEFPWVFPDRSDTMDVFNDGTEAPLYLEIRGEATGVVVSMYDSSGDLAGRVAVDGTIDAGDRLVIDGGDVILHHADGTSEDGWDLLEPVDSDPFDLPPGSHTFTLTASSMPSGSVRGVWHRHHPAAA